jgi:toxin FitB
MYLIDTNAISEMRKRHDVRDTCVAGWFAAQDHRSLALSVVTLLEIEEGVLRIERRDAHQGGSIRRWFEEVVASFEERIVPVDVTVATACARLNVPDRRPYRDALIAGTALVHGYTVVTRNVRDFAPMGVPLLNPWEWGQ